MYYIYAEMEYAILLTSSKHFCCSEKLLSATKQVTVISEGGVLEDFSCLVCVMLRCWLFG
jgi:hypothetical protein